MTKRPGRQARAPRGAHIVDRDAADRALAKREREERRQQALDEARAEQARLERRIEREKSHPALGPAAGAEYIAPSTPEPEPAVLVEDPIPTSVDTPVWMRRFPDLAWEGDGNHEHAIRQARAMLRQGYNVRKVVKKFEVGLKWLDDLPIDEVGFGLTE